MTSGTRAAWYPLETKKRGTRVSSSRKPLRGPKHVAHCTFPESKMSAEASSKIVAETEKLAEGTSKCHCGDQKTRARYLHSGRGGERVTLCHQEGGGDAVKRIEHLRVSSDAKKDRDLMDNEKQYMNEIRFCHGHLQIHSQDGGRTNCPSASWRAPTRAKRPCFAASDSNL